MIVVAAAAVIAAVAAAVAWHFTHHGDKPHYTGDVTNPTDVHGTFDDGTPHADKRFVGEWHNADNPGWRRVYYDDYEADGYYWGKEWNEAEDVHEEDLGFHGNGWFLWKIDGKNMRELHCMDNTDVKVPKNYVFSTTTDGSLTLTDKKFKDTVFSFVRAAN